MIETLFVGFLLFSVLIQQFVMFVYEKVSKYIRFYNIFEYQNFNPDLLLQNETCTICIEDFKLNENILVIKKCKHSFHKKCIQTWINEKEICPNCIQSLC